MATATTPRLVARVIPDTDREPVRATRRRRVLGRVNRYTSAGLVALLVGFLVLMGTSGSGGQAHAFPGLNICPAETTEHWEDLSKGGDIPPAPDVYRSGLDALTPAIDPTNTSNVGALPTGKNAKSYIGTGTPVTAWEWWGTSGLTWTRYNADANGKQCWAIMDMVGNFMANSMFTFTKGFTSIAIAMYQWATSSDLMGAFLTPIDHLLNGGGGVSGGGLKQTLYLEFLKPVIVLGALWAAWQGLAKKRTTEAAQGAVWMLGSAVFALVFMAQPSAIANGINSVVSTVDSVAMSAISGVAADSNGNKDICYLPDSAPKRGPRMASCAIYKALLYQPWVSGQFGTDPGTNNSLNQPVNIGPNHGYQNDVALTQLEGQAENHDESLNDYMTSTVPKDAGRWKAVKDVALKSNYQTMWAGRQTSSRMSIAIASLFAALATCAMVVIVAFAMVIFTMAMLLLILASPLFLLVGAHPGFGRRIALEWLELLIGTVFKKIVLGFMLAILIGFYQVILALSVSWFVQIAMILAISIGAIMYRKPLMKAFNVIKLGGGNSGLAGGEAQRAMNKGTGASVGAMSGGTSALLKGGGLKGMASGAFKGGMSGSRSQSPLHAAQRGASAGSRAANKNKGADKKPDATASSEDAKPTQQRVPRRPGTNPNGNPNGNPNDTQSNSGPPNGGNTGNGAPPRPKTEDPAAGNGSPGNSGSPAGSGGTGEAGGSSGGAGG